MSERESSSGGSAKSGVRGSARRDVGLKDKSGSSASSRIAKKETGKKETDKKETGKKETGNKEIVKKEKVASNKRVLKHPASKERPLKGEESGKRSSSKSSVSPGVGPDDISSVLLSEDKEDVSSGSDLLSVDDSASDDFSSLSVEVPDSVSSSDEISVSVGSQEEQEGHFDSVSSSSKNIVLLFRPEAYTIGDRVEGRRSAGASFFKGFVRNTGFDMYYCMSPSVEESKIFANLASEFLGRQVRTKHIPFTSLSHVSEAGTIFRPDPLISDFAWGRRRFGSRLFSICGITHTTASNTVMQGLYTLLNAPLQEWDCLICTSHSVKSMVEACFEEGCSYLSSKFGCRVSIPFQRPVIPLGINVDDYAPTPNRVSRGRRLRLQLGIKEDSVVCLFVGRLSAAQKMNPAQVYRILDKASQQSRHHLHMIFCGWFASEEEKKIFISAAREMSPRVSYHFVDGQKANTMELIWHCADIFLAPVDNIQETFGLVPVEAMAAGLPVVVGDWDGFKETVVHNEHGFRIPTMMPASGGDMIAWYYQSGGMNYPAYLNAVGQSVYLDIEAGANAIVRLANDSSLRRKMGSAGMSHARHRFDWSRIIPQYQELWLELEGRRLKSKEIAPGDVIPIAPDPFRLFSSYPTRLWKEEDRVIFNDKPSHLNSAFMAISPQMRVSKLSSPPARSGFLKRLRDLLHSSREGSGSDYWGTSRDFLSLLHHIRWNGRPEKRIIVRDTDRKDK